VDAVNHSYRLATRPVGLPTRANWDYAERPVQTPGDGEVLVEVLFLSLDPAMRGWMSDRRSYMPPVGVGEVMRAIGVGRVLASNHASVDSGDHVVGLLGVQQYALAYGGALRKVDPDLAPLRVWLSALGMPGMTAYFGLLDVGQPKTGETLVISGGAGAVGQWREPGQARAPCSGRELTGRRCAHERTAPADQSDVRRLRPGQRVKVELDDDVVEHSVNCLVAEVFGSMASLTHAEVLGPKFLQRLSAGAPGYLVFSHKGAEIALHGVAAAAPSRTSVIDFVVVDGVQVRERRKGRRLPFVTRARLFPTDAGAAESTDAGEAGNEQQAIETFTLDLSEGGALLRYRPLFAEHRRYTIELFFAADPRPLRCEAVRARRTDAGIGVEFGDLDGSDQARLAAILGAYREARQKRPSSTATPTVRPAPRQAARRPVMQDMSDLESALGEFGVDFRKLFDAASNGMAVMALDGRWIGVNPALCERLGYDHEELLERGLAVVSHPDDAQSTAVLMRTLLAGEIPKYTLNNRYIRKDGVVLATRVSATLIRDEAGIPQVAFIQTEDTAK
jgi:PAS domain S-box-containing protein